MRPIKAFRLLSLPLALLVSACGGGDDGGVAGAGAGTPVPGGTAVVGVLSDFQSFNPVVNTHQTTDDVIRYMLFTPLVMYGEDLSVEPYLAESWEQTDSSVTFKLRQDVKWHDGQPVTAEDVKFTFDLAKNPETASLIGSAYINLVESATVVDPNTIRFDFVAPHAQALEDFTWAPVPKHLLEGVPPAELGQAEFNRKPVGSGPFKLASWEVGQALTLQANPDFPEALGGRPNLDQVVFRVIPEATTMMTEVSTGGVDVACCTLFPDQARQLAQQDGVDLRHYPSREFAYIGWNNEREPFTDPQVRRALTMGINREQIIEALLHGYGEKAHGMIPPWSPLYTEAEGVPYNPQQAQQLLAQAGWRDTNGDGILEKNGKPLRFTMLTSASSAMRQDIATVVQQQLRQIGADVQLQTAEFQTMLRQHKAREYDAVISGWILDNFKIDPTPLFACEEARTAGSANRAGYCNPQADQLIEQGLRAEDPRQAKTTWAQFENTLIQDQPITFLFWLEDLAAVGPRLQNVEMDVRSKFVNVDEWWIPENRRR